MMHTKRIGRIALDLSIGTFSGTHLTTKVAQEAWLPVNGQQRHEHVSWERVVSGPGLVSLHEFLCLHRGVALPGWLQHEMEQGDAAAGIAEAALSERDDLCIETLDWFVRLYGAEAGNLALKVMSRGGVYLGGGIAPKILPVLQSGRFLEGFFSKGRMRPLLEAMPVRVILNARCTLWSCVKCLKDLTFQLGISFASLVCIGIGRAYVIRGNGSAPERACLH